MENKVEKNRIQKLAGINEETAFKNGKFKLDRFDIGDYGRVQDDPNGEWCDSIQVSKLEELAAEMLEVVQMTISTSASSNLGGIGERARAVIKKAKSFNLLR
jgi:hypothetical protein